MPAAKIIHCYRHPLDNVLSMLRSNLQVGNNYTSDPSDAASFLVDLELTMTDFKQQFPSHLFSFDYDRFVKCPHKVLPSLINWLGFEWNNQYLHPEDSNRSITTASVIQARQPINNKSVGGWKNYRSLLQPAEVILRKSSLFQI